MSQEVIAGLRADLHNRVIFEKVAALTGYVPPSEKAAAELLATAETLYAQHQSGNLKTASEAEDFVTNACRQLNSSFTKAAGMVPDAAEVIASRFMASRPDLAQGVYQIKVAEAAQAAQALVGQHS